MVAKHDPAWKEHKRAMKQLENIHHLLPFDMAAHIISRGTSFSPFRHLAGFRKPIRWFFYLAFSDMSAKALKFI